MMMTCRLLCALLVLALCCCPSVGVADTDTESADVPEDEDGGRRADQLATVAVSPHEETVPSGLPVKEPGEEQGTTTREGKRSTYKLPKSDEADDTVQKKGKNGTTGTETDKNTSTDKTNVPTTTTSTTTTLASNITTTTTTTTTAPEAPSTTTTTTTSTTTTTQSPTTTTTRAPSRLREIDGSLSSSAWVCAPLLLAVSALAYTTLG
ncbi:putative mucin TcMUCII [Trypanosoma cruzi]|uniref:Mucin TcMUCII, putative n=2 Tax=Trypanosoma cruzi TaxID=5693 RepID=Q4DXP4_TRYCC|nr:mucin TcMUCII, putative [Trypanosoma cruzi]EAN97293.1 mucin TcMUCII, putative [Trypanosoma cruzi]PWV21297.1 putative mucin TcMUCII [Trypanosoma cruzi]|eukprot:XP_819144.1 mucin TcMUCII [Trypanosoma cruzi strain CL Brener]